MRRFASNFDAACVTLIVALLLALPALSVAQSTEVLRTPWGDPSAKRKQRAARLNDFKRSIARRAPAVPGTTDHNGETGPATQSIGPP